MTMRPLEAQKYRHLVNVLKKLANDDLGFDATRDERTKTKEGIIAYMVKWHRKEDIEAAHDAVCKMYAAKMGNRHFGKWSDKMAGTSDDDRTGAIANDPRDDIVGAIPASDAKNDLVAYQPAKALPAALPVVSGDAGAQLAALIASIAGNSLNADQVKAIVVEAMLSNLDNMKKELLAAAKGHTAPTVVHVTRPDAVTVDVGVQHSKFPLLLKACSAVTANGRLNIWLAGPPGSGKTTAASAVAKALGLNFYTNGAIDMGYKLTGYSDANGKYHTTAFREAWAHGGVYLFDEVDASSPSAVVEFNAALANGHATFPDEALPLTRHPDCIILAGANTAGLGATSDYTGRARQDAAFLNRFVLIDWPIDETLERAISGDDAWVSTVQAYRAKYKARGIKGEFITPRASVYGAALLAAGLSKDEVLAMTIRKGMSADAWDDLNR